MHGCPEPNGPASPRHGGIPARMPAMSTVSDLVARTPTEIRRAGGSVPWRLGLLGLALLLNIGFYVPSIPSGIPGAGVPGLDKVVHVVLFALTVWAAGRVLAPVKRFPMGWVVIVALVHAGLIELIQQIALPDRAGSAGDLVADVVGIALGLGLWIGERQRRHRLLETVDVAGQEPVSPRA